MFSQLSCLTANFSCVLYRFFFFGPCSFALGDHCSYQFTYPRTFLFQNEQVAVDLNAETAGPSTAQGEQWKGDGSLTKLPQGQ